MNLTICNLEFEQKHKNEFTTLFYNAELSLAVCIAIKEYIPIADFKESFYAVDDLMSTLPVRHLIFDKRNLRTFHQPSMEWYFALWKTQSSKKGLVNHYKILPPLEWFAKAVEAGKDEIFTKYGRDFLKGINVEYVASETEVVEKLLRLHRGDQDTK